MFQPQPTPFASFAAYRARGELPDYGAFSQHQHQHQHQQQQQHQHPLQQQLPPPQPLALHGPAAAAVAAAIGAVGGAAPSPQALLSSFASPAFSTAQGHVFSSFHPSSNTASASASRALVKMESSAASDDLAAQEAAARDYQPELEGPLVGEKTPSHAITEEYAKADPTYVAKTLALPTTYSDYRPIQGDGNCGWRAIGFSYFEILINGGDLAKINAEQQRISRLDHFLVSVGGYNRFVFEDMVEETFALFQAIVSCLPNTGAAMAVLTEKFNNHDSANAIIYHLRLLAASWLKGNVQLFQDFIPGGGGIQGYCAEWVERPDREIDHLGIILLFSVLLKPAGLVLEIAYLDRSEGDQVNVYRYPEEANDRDRATLGPIIYLLYRPDHYDILYRSPLAPATIQVNRATSFSHQHEITSNTPSLQDFTAVDMSPLTMLPGFGGAPPGLSPLAAPPISPPIGEPFTPSPQSAHAPWLAHPFANAFPPAQPVEQPQPAKKPAASAAGTSQTSLRFSKWQYPELMDADLPEPTFTTNSFKNSHFNTAHYNNPNFQPEEYNPSSD